MKIYSGDVLVSNLSVFVRVLSMSATPALSFTVIGRELGIMDDIASASRMNTDHGPLLCIK
jgi:hypothetical protein